jgi:hypothetical protein
MVVLRHLMVVLRHLMVRENRAKFNVTIVTFNGRLFCDIKRHLRHLAVIVRHLAVSATFSGVATYNGATKRATIVTNCMKHMPTATKINE